MPLAVAASSTGASAIRGGAARSARRAAQQPLQHQQKPQQQSRRHQPLALRPRAASPNLAGFGALAATRPVVAPRSSSSSSSSSNAQRAPAAAAAAAAATDAPPAAAAAAKKAAPAPAAGPFTNTQRFVVAPSSAPAFQAAWREREAAMRQQPGFSGLSLISDGEATVVEARWASVADFERWMLLDACRRSHLPPGVWQYVPRRGEGFPEDFVPFVAYDEPVNAKYF